MSSTFKQDQAKLQRRPSGSDLPAQLHGCSMAFLLLLTGMTREKLKEASQDEGNEEDHDWRTLMWQVRGKKFWVLIFLMRDIRKEKGRKKMLVRKFPSKDSHGKIFWRSPVFSSAYYIWLSCTAQLSSLKLLKAFLLRRAIFPPVHLPWKTGFPPSEAEPSEAELAWTIKLIACP